MMDNSTIEFDAPESGRTVRPGMAESIIGTILPINPVLQVDRIDTLTGFLALRPEWNALVDRSPVHVYQLFDWQWFWWKHYGQGHRLHILTFRRNNRLVGIIPMFLQETSIAGRVIHRRLRMMGCGIASGENAGLPGEYGPSDYLDMIVQEEDARSVARRFANYVNINGTEFDTVEIEHLPQDSLFLRCCVPELEAENLTCEVTVSDICPYIAVPSAMEAYVESLPSGMRHKIRQAKKEFSKGGFSIEAVPAASMTRSAFQELAFLHQSRWNRMGYAGLFSDRRFTGFQYDVLEMLRDEGLVWFKAVRMGGIYTAMRLGFIFKGRIYDYLSGFDETLPGAKKRPSLALMAEMISDAVANGVTTVDLLRGEEQYKFELTLTKAKNYDMSISGFRRRSVIRAAVYRTVRFLHNAVHRLSGEWVLLMVHFRMQGAWRFFFSYARFTGTRMWRKLFRPGPHGRKNDERE